ncbi:MAG TPA: hypothetical protein VLT13_07345 [Bacteroidota bacterium]|nr:hypothetical protein [Bacteroidota bacterium]
MDKTPARILTILLCLRALPGIGYSQTRDGLMGHHWGTPVAVLADNVELRAPRNEGELLLYSTGVRSLGDVAIEQCDIEFVDGRLAGVIVTTRSRENSRRLLTLLQKDYGEGTSNHPRARTWLTPNTHVSYDEDSLGDAYIYWYSTLLQR